jgi:2-C-methyl-D-erythritol 4-phosphate cytidylyltransferase
MNNSHPPRFWVVIPAAGIGARMGAQCPKQYLPLCGKPILQHTLERMALPEFSGIVLALSAQDSDWDALQLNLPIPLYRVTGGQERCHSVLNALNFLTAYAQPNDWVLVHDAARPCVRREDIYRLMRTLENSTSGGLLATPVRDTMKRADANHIVQTTVSREYLYHALTPQMFRFQCLQHALTHTLHQGVWVTDEAQAVELCGEPVQLITGHADNLKITHPHDLDLAQLYLQQQTRDEN